MADNNPRLPKKSWRDNQPAGATSKKGRRAWQKEQGQEAAGPWWTRRTKIWLTGGAIVLVAALIVVVYLILRPIKPFHFVLLGAGYETNLAVPANAYGRRGLDELDRWVDEYNQHQAGYKKREIPRSRGMLAGDVDAAVAEALRDCKSLTVLGKLPPAVVYVSAHGGVDGQGPYLLPDDYSPRNTGNTGARYRFDRVLNALGELPENMNKLLVLDVTGVAADWPLGMFHNDFARQVETAVDQKHVPNLVVLCASGPDQRSWVAEETGQTVFAHYVLEGLKGAAQRNGPVTAGGLADYVTSQVERWARHNRNALQKPVLIGPKELANKMELASAETTPAATRNRRTRPRLPRDWPKPGPSGTSWGMQSHLQVSTPPTGGGSIWTRCCATRNSSGPGVRRRRR
jgi:hypothetical protein